MLAKPERFWEKQSLVLVNLRKIKTMSSNPRGGIIYFETHNTDVFAPPLTAKTGQTFLKCNPTRTGI